MSMRPRALPEVPEQVERTIAWYHGMKRLRIRWERRDNMHEAFLNLATCIITYRHVRRLC
jgi:hypothetical protein